VKLTSDTFESDATTPDSMVYRGFGLEGGNRSPHLRWSDVPEGTKSFALVLHDPDAPTSGGFYHWAMFDIPGDVRELQAGAGTRGGAGPAILGHNDFGEKGYSGMCPPPGDPPHHYTFTVHALDVPSLGFDENATGALIEFAAGGHTLAKASLTGTYARP
jgi:hypothetical protein